MSAAQFSLRPIKDIMIPAADICMIPQNSSLSDALILAHLDMHTRFPVCEKSNDPQTIQGYINFKDIIAALKINPEDPDYQRDYPAPHEIYGYNADFKGIGKNDPGKIAYRTG